MTFLFTVRCHYVALVCLELASGCWDNGCMHRAWRQRCEWVLPHSIDSLHPDSNHSSHTLQLSPALLTHLLSSYLSSFQPWLSLLLLSIIWLVSSVNLNMPGWLPTLLFAQILSHSHPPVFWMTAHSPYSGPWFLSLWPATTRKLASLYLSVCCLILFISHPRNAPLLAC